VPRGLTLVELLITLAIAALLLRLAVPGVRDLLAAQRAAAASNGVVSAVHLARSAAITFRVSVVLCPSRGGRCGSQANWPEGGLIFGDENGNAEYDDGERLFGAMPALERGALLRWRSFRNRSYLRFEPSGLTAWQNGHFQYCPASGDIRHARQVIINSAGRTRVAHDTDGDGIREDAAGRDLRCS
jgi:type IV fimbrial biogenesis protein FimT